MLATDSAQARSFDFEDSAKNVYRYDIERLHPIGGGVVVAEGGNPQIFAAFNRRLTLESATKGGIEMALKKAPTLMNRSARAWETETKYKRPKADAKIIRDARSTYSVITGWSVRRKRILAGTVADDPTMNSLAPENGYLVQYSNQATKKATEEIIKAALFSPAQKTQPPLEAVYDACRQGLKAASEIEEKRLGYKKMGGPVRIIVFNSGDAPVRIMKPEIIC